ncbi:hypothetical protein MMC07_007334 [Pseudocyphellaria aurata]|nr:hypothetical protein [Pseudocyphellaria aurata]
MSDEIAQAPTADSVNSNAVVKVLPNAHPEPTTSAVSENHETTVSSIAGPKTPGSDHAHAPSTTAQSPSSKEALTSTSANDDGVPSVTTPGPQTALLEGQQAPAIPIRSSSNLNLQSSSVSPAIGQVSGDQTKASQIESKGGLKAGSRSGSVASSKHSKTVVSKTPAGASKDGASAANTPSTPLTEKPRKRGVSKFLSYLNCCSAPENANTVEGEAVPPKKAKVLQARGRQPLPVVKPSASAADSSAAESKETADENIGGPPYSELTPAAKPKMLNPPRSRETVPSIAEKPALPDSSGQNLDEKRDPDEQVARSQPVLPLPATNVATNLPTSQNDPTAPIPPIIPSTSSNAAAIEPPATIPADPNVSESAMAVDDRTLKQEERDSDVPMVDAPPVGPSSEEKSKGSEGRDDGPPQINLPPPPPRNGQDRPAGGVGRSPSNAATPSERQQWLLPPLQPRFRGKKCLVLDLDETLVHSSFKILNQADFTIPVEIEGQYHNVYVIKRPGVDQFMKRVGELYEVVVFTASVSKYGDPLLDQLDIHNVVHHRLFRESCYNHQGNYVKDLSQVGRDLKETIIIDNSPTSYIFHPQHAVPISSWFSDAHDNELLDLIPVLEDLAGAQVRDVSLVLDVAL